MEPDDREPDKHTSEIRRSQADAERVMEVLQERGWTIYPERVPLQGQSGYYCVQIVHNADGSSTERAHSVRWNIFKSPLRPVTVGCRNELDLLSFIWRHAGHPGFDYFHYDDDDGGGDVGFVCYCRASRGYSYVLRVGDSLDEPLNGAAVNLLGIYDNDGDV